MGIKPIRKVQVGEQVFKQLKELLIEGEWKQGDKLPSENELADLFGVSRITVRQALQKLVALGLLETRLGEGSFVKKVEVENSLNELIPTMYLEDHSMFTVFEFREIIDTESARLAAMRATDEDIKVLEDILGSMVDAKEKADLKAFAKADLDFHVQIGKMTMNPLIIKTNSILQDILMISMTEVVERLGCEAGLYYHNKMLDAIRRHDAVLAMDLMREHIGKNVEYFDVT